MKIDVRIVQEADNLSKETGMSFRACLEILMETSRQEAVNELASEAAQATEAVDALNRWLLSADKQTVRN